MSVENLSIAVLGKGDFGSSIGSLLEYNEIKYSYITRDNTGPDELIDVLFIAVPTQYVRAAYTENLHRLKPETIIVNCAKGIEEGTHLLPHQIINEVQQPKHYLSIIGPSFAKEIVNQDPSIVSLGYSDHESALRVKGLIETPYFDAVETNEYRTLELAGALKNVYAILCGYAAGIGFGKNTNVKIILSVKAELQKLSEALGYAINDIDDTPGILGDLILTCGSDKSRNYSFGYRLAQDSAADIDMTTVEGYHTCHSISEIANQYHVFLPLASLATRISAGASITPSEMRKILSTAV